MVLGRFEIESSTKPVVDITKEVVNQRRFKVINPSDNLIRERLPKEAERPSSSA